MCADSLLNFGWLCRRFLLKVSLDRRLHLGLLLRLLSTEILRTLLGDSLAASEWHTFGPLLCQPQATGARLSQPDPWFLLTKGQDLSSMFNLRPGSLQLEEWPSVQALRLSCRCRAGRKPWVLELPRTFKQEANKVSSLTVHRSCLSSVHPKHSTLPSKLKQSTKCKLKPLTPYIPSLPKLEVRNP